jgi:hypothetical protein
MHERGERGSPMRAVFDFLRSLGRLLEAHDHHAPHHRVAALNLGVRFVQGRRAHMPPIERPSIEIVDVEQVLLSISPKDEDGRAVVDPEITWAINDESVITLKVAEDGLSALAISGAPGTAVVTVTHGDLSETMQITVKPGEPSSLNLSAGVPVHE